MQHYIPAFFVCIDVGSEVMRSWRGEILPRVVRSKKHRYMISLVHKMMAPATILLLLVGCLAFYPLFDSKFCASWNIWQNTHGRLCGDRICCVRRCFRSWTTCYVTRPRQLLWHRTWDTHVSKIERNRFSTELIALEILQTDGNGLIHIVNAVVFIIFTIVLQSCWALTWFQMSESLSFLDALGRWQM